MTFSTDPFSADPLRTHSSDDDRAFRARCRALGDRILDGVAETLDELARERDRPAALRALIAQRVRAHTAPLICSQATCRRAKACRRKRCRVCVKRRTTSRAQRRDASVPSCHDAPIMHALLSSD